MNNDHYQKLEVDNAELVRDSKTGWANEVVDGRKENISLEQQEIRRLTHELEGLTNAGVVECMVRNKAVAEYITQLERENAALKESIEQGYKPCQEQLEGWLEKANAENAALRADAERYRWLRIQPFDEVRDLFRDMGTEQQRDAAIDAAREKP